MENAGRRAAANRARVPDTEAEDRAIKHSRETADRATTEGRSIVHATQRVAADGGAVAEVGKLNVAPKDPGRGEAGQERRRGRRGSRRSEMEGRRNAVRIAEELDGYVDTRGMGRCTTRGGAGGVPDDV